MRLLLLTVFTPCFLFAQTFFERADSLHKGRTIGTSVGIGVAWSGSMIGLSQVWYKDVPKSSFHFFNDGNEWLQMDKMGHIYTANKLSSLTYDLFHWSGWNNTSATLMGFGVSTGYQLTLELLDGFSRDWGFSWWDVAANTFGSSLFLAQQLTWKEQRILMKFSYHPTTYAKERPSVLGSTFTERLLKDYNGQTYWLSINLSTFGRNNPLPKWLCFSLGYSVDGKINGVLNDYTNLSDPSKSFHAQREFLMSLDIDFSRIKTKKPWLNVLLKQFNYIKIPFPALRWKGDVFYGHWLYF